MKNELQEIVCIEVSLAHPDIFIVLDEAYTEMRLVGKHKVSLCLV